MAEYNENKSATDAEDIEVLRVTRKRCLRSHRSRAVGKRRLVLPDGRTNIEAIVAILYPRNAMGSLASTRRER